MRYTGGAALVEVLKRQEVKAIFCSPGSEWGPVWEALVKLHAQGDREPEYFNCRHEMLAASAAIGYAQKGGGLPAILLHTAAGMLHCSMAIHGAYTDRVPLLVFAGESVRFTEGEDTESNRGWQWLHLSDVGGPSRLAAPFVKWSQAVTSRETLPGAIARACQIARQEPQGPVLLSIAKEYLQEELEEDLPRIPSLKSYSAPNPADVEKIAAWLRESRNPLIITERAGAQPGVVPKLVALAETLAIPVFESLMPESANFPKEHSLHAGYDVKQAIGEADVVLVVEAMHPWNPQLTGPRPEARVLFIDSQAPYPQFPFWNYRSDMIVAADALLTLESLLASVQAQGGSSAAQAGRADNWRAKHEQMLASWDQRAHQARQKQPIDPYWLCSAINAWLPPEVIVIQDITTARPAVNRLIRRIQPGNFYKGNVRGLGSGMGVALGAKVAAAEQPVVHLVGDGSFNYAPVTSALGFAQEYHLPVLTIIFNNGSYRAMKSAHLRLYPEGWASRTQTFYGAPITPNPDYAQLMRVFDGYGEKVADPEEITPALNRAWAEIQQGRSALLDVILDAEDPR